MPTLRVEGGALLSGLEKIALPSGNSKRRRRRWGGREGGEADTQRTDMQSSRHTKKCEQASLGQTQWKSMEGLTAGVQQEGSLLGLGVLGLDWIGKDGGRIRGTADRQAHGPLAVSYSAANPQDRADKAHAALRRRGPSRSSWEPGACLLPWKGHPGRRLQGTE